MDKTVRIKLIIFQIFECILFVNAMAESPAHDFEMGNAIEGCVVLYHFVYIITAVILLGYVCTFSIKALRIANIILFLNAIIGALVTLIWIIVLSVMFPVGVLWVLEIPNIFAIGLSLFIILKKKTIAIALSKTNLFIWKMVAVIGIIGIIISGFYSNYVEMPYGEIIPSSRMIGIFGLYYSFSQMLVIREEDMF